MIQLHNVKVDTRSIKITRIGDGQWLCEAECSISITSNTVTGTSAFTHFYKAVLPSDNIGRFCESLSDLILDDLEEKQKEGVHEKWP